MPQFKDLTGLENDGVVVLKDAGSRNGRHFWLFRCKHCGNEFRSNGSDFSYGRIHSCGCVRKKKASQNAIKRNATTMVKHGKTHTRLYTIWHDMKSRCNLPGNIGYENYGGRGIKVCEQWEHDFIAFHDWAMANGYQEHLTIDRIDNDKGYCPENCRWATMKEQRINQRPRVKEEK